MPTEVRRYLHPLYICKLDRPGSKTRVIHHLFKFGLETGRVCLLGRWGQEKHIHMYQRSGNTNDCCRVDCHQWQRNMICVLLHYGYDIMIDSIHSKEWSLCNHLILYKHGWLYAHIIFTKRHHILSILSLGIYLRFSRKHNCPMQVIHRPIKVAQTK